jgi:hypothetical protein
VWGLGNSRARVSLAACDWWSSRALRSVLRSGTSSGADVEIIGVVNTSQKRIVTACLLCVLKLELMKAIGLVSFSTPSE